MPGLITMRLQRQRRDARERLGGSTTSRPGRSMPTTPARRPSCRRPDHPRAARWPNRDPINESGHKLLRGEIRPLKLREELALYGFVANDPVNGLDLLGLGHNFGRCCNSSGGDEWALEGGKWTKLKPGECTGVFGDCDGMTCGGGFYYVSALEGGNCKTPGCDSSPYNNRRWQPDGGGDTGGRPPGGLGGRGSTEGNTPPGYKYGPPPPCGCKSPRPGAAHNR